MMMMLMMTATLLILTSQKVVLEFHACDFFGDDETSEVMMMITSVRRIETFLVLPMPLLQATTSESNNVGLIEMHLQSITEKMLPTLPRGRPGFVAAVVDS
jgi:hypothetical protein